MKQNKRGKELMEDKGLPFSEDAEGGIHSCLLQSPELISDIASEPPELFYHPANRILRDKLVQARSASIPMELPSLCTFLIDEGVMVAIGGPGRLAELCSSIPSPAHYSFYKGILKEKLALRRVISSCGDTIDECYSRQNEVAECITNANARISSVAKEFFASQSTETWDDAVDEFEKQFVAKMKGEVRPIIPSGWKGWDKHFGGITKEFHIVKGKTSRGKTSLALNILERVAVVEKQPSIWFPYEMSKDSIISRLISSLSGVDSNKVFKPGIFKPDRNDMRKIAEATARVREAPIEIVKQRYMPYEFIERKCDEFAARHGSIALFGVDYLQKVADPTTCSDKDKKSDKLAENSNLLFQLQQDLKCTGIVISSTNADGGTLGSQGADYDTDIAVTVDRFEGTRINKNRNGGGVGEEIELFFHEECVRFENPSFSKSGIPTD